MRLLLAFAIATSSLLAQYRSFTIGDSDLLLPAIVEKESLFPLRVEGGVAPYRFSVSPTTPLPPGVGLDANTGTIRVASSQLGFSRLEVCAHDATNATVCKAYLIRVRSTVHPAPTVLTKGRVNNFYDRAMEGASGNAVEFTFGDGSLPPGVTLNTFGRIVGTPLAPGMYGFTLQSRHLIDGTTGTREYVWEIDGALLQSVTLPNGFQQTPYSVPLAVTGGTAPYTWSLLRGPLPPGFTLEPDGRLLGQTSVAGGHRFLVRVQDALRSSFDREVSMLIEPTLTPLQISSTTLPPASLGTPYQFVLGAVGGRAPYSWRIASGQLPAGLQMTADGKIAGTPTALGSHTVQLELRDLSGASAVRSFTLAVVGALSITTQSPLLAATRGVPYRSEFAAGGGTPPYQWGLESGKLPSALTLSAEGVLAGTVIELGSFPLGVRVTDSKGATASVSLTLTVRAAPPVIAPGGILSAASFQGEAIAPGQIVTIFADPLSVSSVVSFTLDEQNKLPTRLAATRLLVDGVAAPLLYVASGQLSAIVPYGIHGKATVPVAVETEGVLGPVVEVPVTDAAPALFTAAASGKGLAASYWTQDVVTLYLTGEGRVTPRPVDGSITGEILPQPLLPVRVLIGGREAKVLYAGGAPGLVVGLLQINVRIPEGVQGDAIPITVRVGGAESPTGVTLQYQPAHNSSGTNAEEAGNL